MKKKGFTLIELLAVILIIGIIALIAIPIVSKIIRLSRIRAAVASTYGYVKAANQAMFVEKLNNGDVEEEIYDVNDNEFLIKYSGVGPTNGSFSVEKNSVLEGDFCFNGIQTRYEDEKAKYVKNGNLCKTVAPEPEGTYLTKVCNNEVVFDYNETFKIKKPEDFVCFAQLVNSGNTFSKNGVRTKIILVKDIDMSGYSIGKIGNNNHPFDGDFNGYHHTLSNISISDGNDYTGLIGYNKGLIYDLNVDNLNVQGTGVTKFYVGALVGYNTGTLARLNLTNIVLNAPESFRVGSIVGHNTGTVNLAILDTINVTGKYIVGTAVGENSGSVTNIIIRNGKVKGTSADGGVGGVIGQQNSGNVTVVYESGSVTHTGNVTNSKNKFIAFNYGGNVRGYVSTSVTGSVGIGGGISYPPESNGSLDLYADVIDTWHGGDNDSDGYYFDYASETDKTVVIKNVNENPIYFNLNGEGTEENPYQIKTVDDWKQASSKPHMGYVYKVMNDISFENKNFYSLGTLSNNFDGTLEGNNKKLTNIIIRGGENAAVFGRISSTGSVKNLKVEQADILGASYTGIVGYSQGKLDNLVIKDNIMNGYNNVGTIGYLKGEVKRLTIQDNTITGYNYVGSLTGYNLGQTIENMTFTGNEITGIEYVGGVIGQSTGSIIEGTIENIKITELGVTKSYMGGVVGHNSGSILRIKPKNITINAPETYSVGGIAGVNTGTINLVIIDTTDITAKYLVGNAVGGNSGTATNIIIRNGKVKGTSADGGVGGVIGQQNSGKVTVMYESGSVTPTGNITNSKNKFIAFNFGGTVKGKVADGVGGSAYLLQEYYFAATLVGNLSKYNEYLDFDIPTTGDVDGDGYVWDYSDGTNCSGITFKPVTDTLFNSCYSVEE